MRKRGFTLIELLVVIAIIALLLSVILPGLNKAKQIAAAAVCMSNNSQLAKAYYTYADENKGFLSDAKPAGNNTGLLTFTINGSPHRAHSFVAEPFSATGTMGHTTVEDEIRGFEKGGLWPYLMNPDIYHCPVDRRSLKPASIDPVGGYRSYSLGAVLSAGGSVESGTGEDKAYIIKYSGFTTASSKVTFLEEQEGSGDNENYWNMFLGADKKWWDPFAIVHNGSSTFAFADGHAERHRWRDPIMIEMATPPGSKNRPADLKYDDYEWFKRSYIPGLLRK